jgi:outer membrane protein TolC
MMSDPSGVGGTATSVEGLREPQLIPNVVMPTRGTPWLGLALALPLLVGCARYAALPLARVPQLAPDVAFLVEPPLLAGQRLSVEQIIELVLERNPDLRATRAKKGVAQAQLTQSGILPNPSLASAILPLLSDAGSVPAWNVALTQDVKSLITYRSKRRAAGFAAQQVDADILWQEWQMAGQARQLTIDLIIGERSRPTYEEAFRILSHRNDVMQKALTAGNVTLVTASPTMVAFQTARTNLDTLDQHQLHLRHQLNALLGLVPEAVIPLATDFVLPPFDPASIRADLGTLPDRRPDLLALRLGYASQDEVVRQQILSQFPDLIVGGSVNSDNSRVVNGGPQATIGLPIFDRNQGNIAIARATRAQLNAEYAAHLTSAVGEVGGLLREMGALSAQLVVVSRDLPGARLAADRAASAFGASNLDERSYVDLITNYFTKEQEVMTIQLALLDRQVALQTLVGSGLPSVDTLASMPAAKWERR